MAQRLDAAATRFLFLTVSIIWGHPGLWMHSTCVFLGAYPWIPRILGHTTTSTLQFYGESLSGLLLGEPAYRDAAVAGAASTTDLDIVRIGVPG